MNAWLLLATVALLGSSPSSRELLLDAQARQAFVERWSPAYLRVRYQLPPAPHESARFRPTWTTLATLVESPSGQRHILAPAHRLTGVDRVTLVTADGHETAATVELPDNSRDVPMARLHPVEPKALAKLPALKWVPRDELEEGLRIWAIEYPENARLPGGVARPVLVDEALGKAVEYPLERFYYVPLGHADGLALLRADGGLVCIVFRAVPDVERSSLCTPGDSARVVPPRPKPKPEPLFKPRRDG